jgi:F-type H+-transporting ATPase subunit epsilon
MKLDIITPDTKIFSGEVKLVQVPGSKGAFTILKNHAPIVSTLEKGKVRVVDERSQNNFYDIKGGLIEVRDNEIIILAD